MPAPSANARAVADRLDGVVVLDLTVAATRWVAPSLRELRLAGDLSGFHPLAGQDVMVSVLDESGTHRWRRYSVRRHDGDLVLWVSTDSSGPGGAWANLAEPGDAVEAVGPRGKISLDPTALAHLFVVDESGLAPACAMAEALAAPSAVHLASPHDGDPYLRPAVSDGVALTTSELAIHTPTSFDTERLGVDLEGVLASLSWPAAAATAAYVFGELTLTRRAVSVLEAVGIAAERIASKAYWRADRPNADRGEPDRP